MVARGGAHRLEEHPIHAEVVALDVLPLHADRALELLVRDGEVPVGDVADDDLADELAEAGHGGEEAVELLGGGRGGLEGEGGDARRGAAALERVHEQGAPPAVEVGEVLGGDDHGRGRWRAGLSVRG